ncbi:MAG: hypothetical protein ACJAZV_002042 [Roseivirga sp.]|jgi:hypothetical protein
MDFEEMKKIWDTQNNQPLYAIDEDALHRRVKAKKNNTKRTTNKTELILIAANIFAGGLVIISRYIKDNATLVSTTMGVMMLITGAYLIFLRARRIKRDQQVDTSVLGDLDNALENINYRVSLSRSMIWYAMLVAFLTLYSVFDNEKSIDLIILIAVFFVVGLLLSIWEYRHCHVGKRDQLLALKQKLVNDLDFDYSKDQS